MRFVIFAAALVAVAPTLAAAATAQVPRSGKPMATITLPDGWSKKDGEKGEVELEPADGSIHLSLDFEPKPKPLDEQIKEFTKVAGADMTIVDPAKISKSIVSGRTATVIRLQVKVKDATSLLDITVTEIPTKSGGNVEIGVFGIPGNLKEHAADVEAIFDSVKMSD